MDSEMLTFTCLNQECSATFSFCGRPDTELGECPHCKGEMRKRGKGDLITVSDFYRDLTELEYRLIGDADISNAKSGDVITCKHSCIPIVSCIDADASGSSIGQSFAFTFGRPIQEGVPMPETFAIRNMVSHISDSQQRWMFEMMSDKNFDKEPFVSRRNKLLHDFRTLLETSLRLAIGDGGFIVWRVEPHIEPFSQFESGQHRRVGLFFEAIFAAGRRCIQLQ